MKKRILIGMILILTGLLMTILPAYAAPFTGIKISGSNEVEIVCGKTDGVFLFKNEKKVPMKAPVIKDGVLIIEEESIPKEAEYENKILITVSNPQKFELYGTGNINIKNVNSAKLVIKINRNVEATASGKVKSLILVCDDNSSLDGKKLVCTNADVKTMKNGVVDIYVSGILTAAANDASTINYYGSPKKVNSKISGAGEIIKK